MHKDAQARTHMTHTLNQGNILPAPDRQSLGKDSDLPIILRTNELDFNSITRANLSQLPPD